MAQSNKRTYWDRNNNQVNQEIRKNKYQKISSFRCTKQFEQQCVFIFIFLLVRFISLAFGTVLLMHWSKKCKCNIKITCWMFDGHDKRMKQRHLIINTVWLFGCVLVLVLVCGLFMLSIKEIVLSLGLCFFFIVYRCRCCRHRQHRVGLFRFFEYEMHKNQRTTNTIAWQSL